MHNGVVHACGTKGGRVRVVGTRWGRRCAAQPPSGRPSGAHVEFTRFSCPGKAISEICADGPTAVREASWRVPGQPGTGPRGGGTGLCQF